MTSTPFDYNELNSMTLKPFDYVDYNDFLRLAELVEHPIAKYCPKQCYEEYLEITKFPYSQHWMTRYMCKTIKKFHKHSKIGALVHMMKNALKKRNISYKDTIGTYMASFFEKELGTDYENISQFVEKIEIFKSSDC